MPYEAEQLAIRSWLDKAARWRGLLAVGGLAACTFAFRCLHLRIHDHYYILSPDSFFFHWVAKGVMAGEPPPTGPFALNTYTLHSGLAYPLAYLAKAAGYVFGLSNTDALNLVAKFLPPLLAVIGMVVIYLAVVRICDRRVALFSALTWALMLHPVFFGAAGYLDRDGLSMLLIMTGAFLFYLSRGWQFRIGGRDVGWLLAGLGVLVLEGILYLEWTFVGPMLLLAIILVYFVVKFLVEYFDRMETEPSTVHRISGAISEANWQVFAVIILGNIAVAGLYPHQAASWLNFAIGVVPGVVQGEQSAGVNEMAGLSLADLRAYTFFLIPIVLGLYLTWKKRAEGSIFFFSWFLSMLVLSLFAKRVVFYAAPAACVLSGVGLAFLWNWMSGRQYQPLKKVGVIALLLLLIVFSYGTATFLGSGSVGIAADEDWQDAMAYLRDETPRDSVIISQWSWGYWILDLGERRPVVDNGYYSYDADRLRDVGLAYSTTDPAEAAQIMKKYGASYLVLSKLDRKSATIIMGWANVGEGLKSFPANSLFVRSINGEFESGGGLEVVYHSVPESGAESVSESEVVILGLTESELP
jgi:asparagine N-glycosylation enzyme membrane subunit Stt3